MEEEEEEERFTLHMLSGCSLNQVSLGARRGGIRISSAIHRKCI